MKYSVEEIQGMLDTEVLSRMALVGRLNDYEEIIRDLLAKIEKYQRKHEEFGDIGRCPLARECSDEWGCEESWAKYWEEE